MSQIFDALGGPIFLKSPDFKSDTTTTKKRRWRRENPDLVQKRMIPARCGIHVWLMVRRADLSLHYVGHYAGVVVVNRVNYG